MTPATPITRTRSGSVGTGERSSESIAARITISPTFANSDGLIWRRLTPGMSMKLLVPLSLEATPGMRSSTRPSNVAP